MTDTVRQIKEAHFRPWDQLDNAAIAITEADGFPLRLILTPDFLTARRDIPGIPDSQFIAALGLDDSFYGRLFKDFGEGETMLIFARDAEIERVLTHLYGD